MSGMIVSFFLFLCCFALHVAAHRVLRARKIVSLKSTVPYAAGLAVLLYILNTFRLPLPASATILFCLLSGLAFVLYVTIYLGGETPSSMILASFSRRKVQTREELIGLFSEEKLIWKRVRDLTGAQLVIESGDLYTATTHGRFVAGLAGWYRKIFQRPDPV